MAMPPKRPRPRAAPALPRPNERPPLPPGHIHHPTLAGYYPAVLRVGAYIRRRLGAEEAEGFGAVGAGKGEDGEVADEQALQELLEEVLVGVLPAGLHVIGGQGKQGEGEGEGPREGSRWSLGPMDLTQQEVTLPS